MVRYVLEKYAAKEYFACLNLPKPDRRTAADGRRGRRRMRN